MKFEEALGYLRVGEKIRRKDWYENSYIYLNKNEVLMDEENERFKVSWSDIKAGWELYEASILNKKEKEYLSQVIRPFRDRVKYIVKKPEIINLYVYRSLRIYFDDDYFELPRFKSQILYKNMELGRRYTLKELELCE